MTNDTDRLKQFDYGLARYFAYGYQRGYDEGTEQGAFGPHVTEAEKVAYKQGFDAGVADYTTQFDDERLEY